MLRIPVDDPLDEISLVFRLLNTVRFSWIGDELCFNAERLQPGIEFKPLWHRNTTVLLTVKNERRCLDVPEILHRRSIPVRLRILIHRLLEVRQIRRWNITDS